jgi:hypothetical protein
VCNPKGKQKEKLGGKRGSGQNKGLYLMILEKTCSCMFLMGSFISRPKNMRLFLMVL